MKYILYKCLVKSKYCNTEDAWKEKKEDLASFISVNRYNWIKILFPALHTQCSLFHSMFFYLSGLIGIQIFFEGFRNLSRGFSIPPGGFRISESFLWNLKPLEGYLNPSSGKLNPLERYLSPSCGFLNPQEGYLNPSSGIINPLDRYPNPFSGIFNPQERYMNPFSGILKTLDGYLNTFSGIINSYRRISKSHQWKIKPPLVL